MKYYVEMWVTILAMVFGLAVIAGIIYLTHLLPPWFPTLIAWVFWLCVLSGMVLGVVWFAKKALPARSVPHAFNKSQGLVIWYRGKFVEFDAASTNQMVVRHIRAELPPKRVEPEPPEEEELEQMREIEPGAEPTVKITEEVSSDGGWLLDQAREAIKNGVTSREGLAGHLGVSVNRARKLLHDVKAEQH